MRCGGCDFSGVVGAAMVATFIGLGALTERAVASTPEDLAFFETNVRPILAEHCYSCHGREKQRSALRLDHINFVLTGGERGVAIVPGDAESSRLIRAVRYTDVELKMPPRGRLSDDELAALTRWVAMGAPWPEEPEPPMGAAAEPAFDLEARKRSHWAWRAIQPYDPPNVAQREWVRDPLDAFVLAKLEAAQLTPAPPAERRDWIRRVTFDLIGLPPTAAEVEAFVADQSPDAHEKVVDRLLDSPHFGEKWARHWMDLVRYAETYGHEFDYPVHEPWRYRDYLIRAFNNDVPYDRLMMEHVAGDMLPDPRIHPTDGYNESIIGTSFWFFHQATHAPVDVKLDTAERVDNQIDVMTKTFLAMTVACARCHDHKFDAISQADFYAMAGFLQSSRQQLALLDPHGKIDAAARAMRTDLLSGQKTLRQIIPPANAPQVAEITRYLQAAREVLHGHGVKTDARRFDDPDIVFDDFEGSLNNWTIEGDAFGTAPATGTQKNQNPVTGFVGRKLLNSFAGSDKPKGKLTSRPFTIDRRFIHFLVGGGAHQGQTCVNLRIDGKVVLTATGRNSEHLTTVVWDVSAFAGQEAVIEIVDAHDGGWGHILVDHIVFGNVVDAPTYSRPVRAVASDFNVDAEVLSRWAMALANVRDDERDHPLYAVSQLAKADAATFAAARARLSAELTALSQRRTTDNNARVFETFSSRGFDGWYVSGHAFGDGPTHAGQWTGQVDGDVMHRGGMAHSGAVHGRLQGVMRSPTFTLDSDYILYRMAGRNGVVRLIIENYQMDIFNALLFEGMKVDVETDGRFVWHAQDVRRYRGLRAHIELIDHNDGYIAVDEIRFADRPQGPEAVNDVALGIVGNRAIDSFARLAEAYAMATGTALRNWHDGRLSSDQASLLNALWKHGLVTATEQAWGQDGAAFAASLTSLARSIQDRASQTPTPMYVLAMQDGPGVDENLFIRGSHRSLGPVVPRRFLEALGGTDAPPIPPHTSGRLQLAQALVADDNPLPARVMVNRVWHHLFGVGIVPTTDDFGVLGQEPTHPELLDHLAHWYRYEARWSTKQLIRRLVLSNTYRMSSRPVDERAERLDPTNALLHRMRIRRLTGESLRDAILMVSGRLDRTMYGGSVPIHLTPFMDGRGRPGQSGPLDGNGRRSVYIEVRRNFLSPMMQAFDMPTPFTTIGRRTVSNVPAQALILMNDPFVVAESKRWAKRVLADTDASPHQRITWMYRDAFGRPPTAEQLDAAVSFLQQQATLHGVTGEAWQTDERVWADLCHVLFNVKDFAFVN